MLELGHGYFAETVPVIHDIREAITTGRKAAERKIPQWNGSHFVIDITQAREDSESE